jgi:hypothetical protein
MITGDVLMMAAVNGQEGTAPSICTLGRGSAADLKESMRNGRVQLRAAADIIITG